MVADSIWHIAKAPALEVLEHTAAQQAIGVGPTGGACRAG